MKRYLVLAGHSYYPAAWDDWVGQYDTVDEADDAGKAKADSFQKGYGWYQVFDLETEQEIEH